MLLPYLVYIFLYSLHSLRKCSTPTLGVNNKNICPHPIFFRYPIKLQLLQLSLPINIFLVRGLVALRKKERKKRKKERKKERGQMSQARKVIEQAKFLQGLQFQNKGGMLSPRSKYRIRSPPSSSSFISLTSLLLSTCTYDLIV